MTAEQGLSIFNVKIISTKQNY